LIVLADLPVPASILVINVSRIGDTLLVTPAVRALAKAWPQARITFLGHPKRIEVIEHLPFVAQTGSITKHRTWWKGWLSGKRWDLALAYGFDRPLVAYALRSAQRVVAFRQDEPPLDEKMYRCVNRPAFQSDHAARFPLLLTRALGIPDAGYRLAYEVTGEERSWARRTLASLPADARPLVGMQIASFPTKGYRDWPLEHFAALCERIRGGWPKAHFLAFGGALERGRTAALARRFAPRSTDYAGRLTLRQSAALMNELDLYIGVDTGPTHIMGALEAPMVALYHCYSPSRLLAPLERARCYVVDHPRAAQGCPPETPMGEIAVEAVYAKVAEALGARA
jgi:heptosyltransferase-3